MSPQDKRLAIKVEDHPLEYQYFEGVIPQGNYGAGTVEVWDHGSYSLPEANDRKEMEKKISAGLKNGHLELILNGSKLKGSFILQKLKKDEEDPSWLLIKKRILMCWRIEKIIMALKKDAADVGKAEAYMRSVFFRMDTG